MRGRKESLRGRFEETQCVCVYALIKRACVITRYMYVRMCVYGGAESGFTVVSDFTDAVGKLQCAVCFG